MKLNDQQLVSEVKNLRAKEKEVLYALLIKLGELDARKLYRDEGYPSFFAYLETGLGYSKAAAYRRVQASRLLQRKPELYLKLESGELSFSSLVELARVADKLDIAPLIEKSSGKSHKEVSELVQLSAPAEAPKKREQVRVVKPKEQKATPLLSKEDSSSASEPNFQIMFQADKEFMALYQEAKALAGGHSMEEVFRKVLSDYTKRKSPKERIKRHKAREGKASASKGRYIPAAVKDKVHVRDGGRCTYVAPDGKRCSCRENVEFDHVKPYVLGGESTPENLRLLCRAHNQLMAERVLGKEFMERRRGEG